MYRSLEKNTQKELGADMDNYKSKIKKPYDDYCQSIKIHMEPNTWKLQYDNIMRSNKSWSCSLANHHNHFPTDYISDDGDHDIFVVVVIMMMKIVE